MYQPALFNAFDALGEIETRQEELDGLLQQVEANKDDRKALKLLLEKARRNLRAAIRDNADKRRESRAPLTLTVVMNEEA